MVTREEIISVRLFTASSRIEIDPEARPTKALNILRKVFAATPIRLVRVIPRSLFMVVIDSALFLSWIWLSPAIIRFDCQEAFSFLPDPI